MFRSLTWKKFLIRTGIARWLPAARQLTDGGAEYLRYYSDSVLAAPVTELLDPTTFPVPPGSNVLDLNQPIPRLESAATLGRIGGSGSPRPSTWGLPSLRETLAEQYRRRDGRSMNPTEEVLITHGATGAYAATLTAFVNPGDRVVLFDPTSPIFALGAASRRARIRWVRTSTIGGRMHFNPAELAQAMRGAKLLVLADPTSPTGGRFGAEELEQIADLAKRHDVLIYLDESLSRFDYEGKPSRLATMPAVAGRILSAGSLTYSFGLPSLRIGWLTGSRHLIRPTALMANLSAPFVPEPCQMAAEKLLHLDEDLFGPIRQEFRSRCRYTVDQLRGMGFPVTPPNAGFTFWLPVNGFGLDGRTFAERLLKEQNVLVGPGSAFGPSGSNFVRLSFAGDDGRLREGLSRLGAFLMTLRGQSILTQDVVTVPTMVEPSETPTATPTEAEPERLPERPPAFSRV
ncbi:MAG: pyridoxal phosphate-dependent aminotransferase [Bacteroidales bacterium]|nr:pyridoxal phosphate-dependent aminotransferase [Bacteroidales bacterium]